MKKFTQRFVFLGPGLFWLTVFLLLPLGILFLYSFMQRGPYGGIVYEVTLDNYIKLFNPTILKIFLYSLTIATVTTVLALLIGYPVAYFIATSSEKYRSLLLAFVILPFWTSYLIRTYAWMVLLNREGIINHFLQMLGLIDEPISLLYNSFAIVIGLLYGYIPFAILPLYSSIERLNPELREASEDLGSTPIRTFFAITLPLTLTGVIASAIFVFVPSLGNFFVPELLGGGQRFMIGNLITNLFLKARNWPYGSAMAFGVMSFVMIILLFQAWVVRRSEEEGINE